MRQYLIFQRRKWIFSILFLCIPVTGFSLHFPLLVFTLNNPAVTPEGYLDVTKSPYNVDNTGDPEKADSNTTSLQNAINAAHQHNLAVFFPAGTYDVNDQLQLFQTKAHMTNVHVLVGSALGARPVIRLQGGNFGDASNPKPLFFYYCSPDGAGPPSPDTAASGYNMVFRGIDIDLNGKAGAVGVLMHAAQGSTIQDVSITATGAFAGIQSLCGSGVTYGNIRIDGGRYGFYITKNKPMPVLTGITCIGQTIRPIHFHGAFEGALTIVGFHFEVPGWVDPVFDLNGYQDDEHLCLVDGSIVITGSSTRVIRNRNRSLHLRNVYVKNGNRVVENNNGPNIVDNSGNWTYFGDYNFFHVADRQLIDGSYASGEYKRGVTINTQVVPPADLISRHLWDEATFPHFEDGNVVFVGPGTNNDDDAARIQTAIDNANGKAVFLKKGDYYLKRSLIFKDDTKLIGLARNLSRLRVHTSWAPSNTQTMITTPVNGADATCMIAWLALQMPLDEGDNVTFLNWTAGQHSMVREVHFMKWGNWNAGQPPHKRIKVSGTGGGRWYSVFTREAYEQGENPNHRMFQVLGTSQPLSIYGFSVEYQESEVYMTEINNSSNVSIYGFKLETDLNGNDDRLPNGQPGPLKNTPALGIIDSQNIIVMGQGGHGELDNYEDDHGLFEIVGDSNHIQIANATGGWWYNTGFGIVRDMRDGKVIKKNKSGGAGDPAAMYLVGDPTPVVYDPNGSYNGGSNLITNIIANGDFESGEMSDYTGFGSIISGANVYSGSYSAEITNNGTWRHIEQIQAVEPNTEYIVSAYLDVSGIGGSGTKAEFMVRFLDSAGAVTGDYENIADVSADVPWQYYSRVVTSPPDAAEVRIRVISWSIPNGTVRVDELFMDTPTLYINDGSGSDPTEDFTHINGSHMSEYSYSGGKLICEASWQPWRRIKLTSANAQSWTDYTLDIDVENTTSGTVYNEVAVVLVRCAGGEDYYGTFIGMDNKLYIGKKSGGNWSWSAGVDSGANFAAYHLKIDVSGSSPVNIDVFVDGATTPTASYSDSSNPYILGGFGLSTRGYHTAFDNIVVKGIIPPVNPNNNPPVIDTISDVTLAENEMLQVNISASDEDNDPLLISAVGIPSFGALTDNGDGTGRIDFSPGYDHAGIYTITLTVSDGQGGTAESSFVLTVSNVNRAPVIASISDASVNENDTLQVTITATDPDNDSITLGATGISGIGSVNDNGDGTGSITFTPDFSQSGTYSITVSADDGVGGNDAESFALVVNNVNQPPVVSPIADLVVDEGCIEVIRFSVSDLDVGDSVSMSLNGLPGFGSFTDNGNDTGTILLNPSEVDIGVYNLSVVADDGNQTTNTTVANFIVTVKSVSDAAVAYYNDFSSGLVTDDFSGDTGSFSITGGELLTTFSNAYKSLYLKSSIFPENTDDFKIVSRMKKDIASGYDGTTLRFRDVDVDNWYELRIRADSGEDVHVFGNEGGVRSTIGAWNSGVDLSSYHTFSLIVSGSSVGVYVDNSLLGNIGINHLTGRLGPRQRSGDGWWDSFRVLSIGEPDHLEDFDDSIAQGWDFLGTDFTINDSGGGDYALKQAPGSNWAFATFNEGIGVDANYRFSVDSRAVGTRVDNYDSPIIVVKHRDESNFLYLYILQNVTNGVRKIKLKKNIGGTASEVTLTAAISSLDDVAHWNTLTVQVDNDKLNIEVNGVEEVSGFVESDLIAPIFDEATTCGVRSGSSNVSVEFDNFKFYDEFSP